MWIDPWFQMFLDLTVLVSDSHCCSCKNVIWQYYYICVVFCALIVVWSPIESIGMSVGCSFYVADFNIILRQAKYFPCYPPANLVWLLPV
jgi:hypothetical protein